MAYADDPWQVDKGHAFLAGASDARLVITPIGAISPIDGKKLGHGERAIPDAVMKPLFGSSNPDFDGLHTYAVLDAGKVGNLLEILDGAGLPHQCLFQGAAREELGHVAPWLVQLRADAPLVRNLFTRGSAPWHLWDVNPGIFLRSALPLAECCSHLRKFTRLPSERGATYLFRFWDGEWAGSLLQSYFDDGLSRMFDAIPAIITRQGDSFSMFQRDGHTSSRATVLSDVGTRNYLRLRQARLCEQLEQHFCTIPEFATWDAATLKQRIDTHVGDGLRLGLTDGADLFSVALGLCLSDRPNDMQHRLMQLETDEPDLILRRRAVLAVVREPIDAAKARHQTSGE